MEFDEVKYKEYLIDLFSAFDTFCKEHSLKYYCAWGTALGVARHKGFIPWDDDIDVYMPRDDYNRLLSLKKVLIGSKYEIIDWDDKGYFLYFAKFCNRQTTLVEKEGQMPIGVYIDIFTLDYYDKTYCKKLERCNNLYRYAWIIYAHSYRRHSINSFKRHFNNKEWGKVGEFILDLSLFRIFRQPCRFLIKKITNLLQNAPITNTYWQYDIIEYYTKKYYDLTIFGDGIQMEFEGLKVVMPKEYDKFLTIQYGDWRTPPAKEKRVSHHFHFFVDFNRRLTYSEIESILADKK